MQKLLDDNDTYEKVSESSFKRIERESNQQLQKLKRERKLDERTYKKLHSTDAIPPAIRGLVKHHKPNNPLRPIITCKILHFTTLPGILQTYFHHYKMTMVFELTTLLNLQRNFTELKLTKTKSLSHLT